MFLHESERQLIRCVNILDDGTCEVVHRDVMHVPAREVRKAILGVEGVESVGTAEAHCDTTRFTVRPVPGLRQSVLAARLAQELSAEVSAIVAWFYTPALRISSKWIETHGFAFVNPLESNARNDFAQHVISALGLTGDSAQCVHHEGDFFVVTCRGSWWQNTRRKQLHIDEIGRATGVHICHRASLTIDSNNAVKNLVAAMQSRMATL